MPVIIHFSQPQPTTQLGCWEHVVSGFPRIVGYTAWGDFILRNIDTGQFAILYAFEPKLEGEVFIPEPHPFFGGLCEPESDAKGNVWTFMDLAGQLQGV